MASFSASPPSFSRRWERLPKDHFSRMARFGSVEEVQQTAKWMQPKPSRKSMWRRRKSIAEEPPERDWSLLPLDALSLVFVRLSAVDVLMGAGLVCRSWFDAAKVPDVWRVVEMDDDEIGFAASMYSHMLRAMAKVAVDRSDGQLRVFAGWRFVTEELLKYIVERSPCLTTLRLVSCSSCFTTLFSGRVADVIRKSPLSELHSLEIDYVYLTVNKLTAVLENCPVLEVLTVLYCRGMYKEDEHVLLAKFARIKNLTFECHDDTRDEYDSYSD